MECEENLALGRVDRREQWVLTGVNWHHRHISGIREGSADGGTKVFHLQ